MELNSSDCLFCFNYLFKMIRSLSGWRAGGDIKSDRLRAQAARDLPFKV
ncbi:hypothetical protein D1AOALGA4SA_12420 [Olavius algarvensis Delta 1 endosymbiont]|nr:hypothetical protein D1AOALGA4SA_12420 [Olavius algarvensis Delta 1 endosymbiont]